MHFWNASVKSYQQDVKYEHGADREDEIGINFQLTLNRWDHDSESYLVSHRVDQPFVIPVSIAASMITPTSVRQTIEHSLEECPFWREVGFRYELLELLASFFQQLPSIAITKKPGNCRASLKASCDIDWDEFHDEDVASEEEDEIQRSIDEAPNFMLAADESAINAALKSKNGSSSSFVDDSCPICMDEFEDDDDTQSWCELPCRHSFHRKCIAKWLRISHFCPCCRFELPTTPA